MKNRNILLIIFALSTFYGCNSTSANDKDNNIQGQNPTNHNKIFLTKKQMKDSGLELTKIEQDTFYIKVSAQGHLDVPPSNKAIISSFMPGKVNNVNLLEGSYVNKGETLLYISNPEFLQIQQNYINTKENLSYLKKEYERQKSLAEDSIASQKKLQRSRNEYIKMLAKYKTLKQKLILLNFNLKETENGNFTASSPVYAPISGYITHLNVIKGSHVNPSDVIMEIVDDSHIHLELKVFEKDVLKLKINQPIEFTIPDMNSKTYHGYIRLIGKKIDPISRTILVHGHLSGNHPVFVSGMYTEAQILTGSFIGLSVPTEAIVKQEENYFILRLVEENDEGFEFEKLQVIPGLTKGKYTQIKINGNIKEGQIILGKGVFFII